MGYDHADRRIYSFGEIDFGAGDDSASIQGKLGKTGILRWIHVAAMGAENFNSVTTGAMVRVGTASDTDAYAQFELPDLADTDSASSDDGTDTNAILAAAIPVDDQVEVTFVAPTGGTPTGKGHVEICIDWAW